MKNLLYVAALLFGITACGGQDQNPLASSGVVNADLLASRLASAINDNDTVPEKHESEGVFLEQEVIIQPKKKGEPDIYVTHNIGEQQLGDRGFVNVVVAQNFPDGYKKHKAKRHSHKPNPCQGREQLIEELEITCTVEQQ